ncbi:NMD protein affecting ribosome stability and mRNA decay [Metallosphaera tengchongensis]|uniref:NMD protein affecting ribosome stability and mRNA decay n=1 Tax=Metallosphaera tengchongensis TaxID=1532350 RepID=A0A6N0NUT8_9CREN|nr:60S ribosomal export protein NMD3 [Metallosphaera tengchongensis]QKR00502.1 NMD protein affecting ribosome stability and mRNA decay [Metallosphaera tengchongensis]
MGRKFCVMCGREDADLIDRLCPSCYVKSREIAKVNKTLELTLCKVCGARKVGNKWVSMREDLDTVAEEEVVSSLALDDHVSEYKLESSKIWTDYFGVRHLGLRIRGKVSGAEFNENKDVTVKVVYGLCDSCVKRRGKYYEAIVQLRSKSGRVQDSEKSFFESFFSREEVSNLSDVVELREGIDYYFINRTVAKRLVAKFIDEVKADVKESYQRERIKRGKREGKLVISLRI